MNACLGNKVRVESHVRVAERMMPSSTVSGSFLQRRGPRGILLTNEHKAAKSAEAKRVHFYIPKSKETPNWQPFAPDDPLIVRWLM